MTRPEALGTRPRPAGSLRVTQGGTGPAGLSLLAAGIFLASRVLTSAGIALAHATSGLSLRLILVKWDAHWYVAVAQYGYPSSPDPLPGHSELRLAFFPLFPLLLRPLAGSGRVTILAATAVGAAFGLAATMAVAHLARAIALAAGCDDRTARRTALRSAALFACFPGSVVLSLAYTEGVTILLSAGCLLALLRRRWLLAGLCAGLASAARPNALALALACAWASYDAIRQRREWRSLAAPLLAPAGFLAYLAYLQVHVGDWHVWSEIEARAWHQRIDFSARLIRLLAPNELVDHIAKADWNYLSVLTGLVFVLVAVAVSLRWRPPALITAYTVGALAFCFLSSRVGPRPRMALLAVPLFLACADRLRRTPYLLLLGLCCAATVTMSYYVSLGRIIP